MSQKRREDLSERVEELMDQFDYSMAVAYGLALDEAEGRVVITDREILRKPIV